MNPFRWLKSFFALDWVIGVVPILLTCLGLVLIYALGLAQNRMGLFWGQLEYAGMGLVLFVIALSIDYRSLRQASPYLYVITVLLLVAVMIFGQKTLGATRWINLGFFQLQPAELMKAFVIFVVANLLADQIGQITWRKYITVLILSALPIVLVLIEPDLGTTIVIAGIVASMLVASRLSARQIGASFLIVVACLGLGWVSLKSYQRTRIEVFLNHKNSSSDSKNSSYNVRQSIIAVGSGGLMGQGIGRGSQSELNFLPVADTDFMFATAAEATGLLGTLILLGLYALLIWRIWHLTVATNDPFAMLVAVGVGSMLLIQVIVNVGMNIGLLPVTGIPLPFVSHGGSSLIVTMFLMGVLESMYLRRKKLQFHS